MRKRVIDIYFACLLAEGVELTRLPLTSHETFTPLIRFSWIIQVTASLEWIICFRRVQMRAVGWQGKCSLKGI